MDQDLYDIDPEYRKKYDADMKKYAKEMEANEKKANARAQKAGYPTAEADFKKEGQKDAVQKYIDEIPKRKAEEEQRMKEYKEGRAKSMEQFNANMQKIGDAHDAKMKELRSTTKSGGGGGGSGGIKSMKYEPKTFKSGGKVSSASKRADGIAVKGKTRGRIV